MKLGACFEQLYLDNPFGAPEVVTTAGVFVRKPGYHGLGRAFDLDAIFWAERTFVTLRYPSDMLFYLGVESVLRQHFGTVLNYLYNTDHHDHFHFTDQSPVGFSTSSRSRVLYLQAAVSHVFSTPVLIDGIWGPETKAATETVLDRLGINGNITQRSTWVRFLKEAAEAAFDASRSREDRSAARLLADVEAELELGEMPREPRRRLAGALAAFREHPDTRKWLRKFEVRK